MGALTNPTARRAMGVGARASSVTAASISFAGLLMLSGFCGISYEILYGRILGNLVGDQFAVNAAVLLTFLLGIGLGTLYAHRLWRYLWAVEAGIGVYGATVALGTEFLDAWLYTTLPGFQTGLGSSICLCAVILIPPAFLIGCSLPLFAGYLSVLTPGRVFARAYAVYNLGAALTALLIEFWLVRAMGIRLTVLSIAGLNGLVAICLIVGYRRLRDQSPERGESARFPRRQLISLALASIASAVFQLLMLKMAECFLGPFRETFALVLALVLAGIAIGAMITERLRLRLEHVLVASLVGLIWLLAGAGWMAGWYAGLYATAVESYLNSVLLKIGFLSVLMGVPAISFGATVPALLTVQKNVARESGQLLFVSSVANAFGFLLMAFVLHRYLDYGVMILLIAGLTSAALWVHAQSFPWRLGVIGLMVAACISQVVGWNENLLYLGHTSFHSRDDLAESSAELSFPERFKGYQDIFSINWIDGKPYFFINGYISIPLTSPSEKIVGAFSSCFAPRTDQALVLGLGSGATAGTVAMMFDQTDVVEINPVVLENLYRMAKYNFDIEHRDNVRIVQDDAIHFAKQSQKTYSLIINTVTTPLYFSSSKLYTHEFLETMRGRLTDDGIYVTWIDSRVGNRGLDIVLKTLSKSFDHCAVGCIKSSYFLLICSQQPIAARHPDAVARNRQLARYFYDEYEILPEWIPYGLLKSNVFDLIQDPDVPVNTLDYPSLEFEMARLRKRGIEQFKQPLRDAMDVQDVATVLGENMEFKPLNLLLHIETLLGNCSFTRKWRALIRKRVDKYAQQYQLASLDYYRSVSQLTDSADAHHKYGFRLLRQGQYEEAIKELQLALSKDPNRNNSHFNIGSSYEKLGRFPMAIDSFQRELQVDPTDEDAPFRIGRIYMRMGKYSDALRFLDQAIDLGRDDTTVWELRKEALKAIQRQ